MSFTVVPYSAYWPAQFTLIKDVLRAHLNDIKGISIEHVGSTAVSDLPAQPVLDICVLAHRTSITSVYEVLLGKVAYDNRDNPVNDCVVLKALDKTPPYIIYLCLHASLPARALVAVRDTLRSDSALHAEYANMKNWAAKPATISPPTRYSKAAFLQKVLITSQQFTHAEVATLWNSDQVSRWPQMHTARLVLREYELQDEEGLFTLESHAANARYQSWHPWTRREARQKLVRGIRCSYESGRDVVELAVEHSGAFIGRIGASVQTPVYPNPLPAVLSNEEKGMARRWRPEKSVLLWYSFLPSVQGRGFATEAVQKLVDQLAARYTREGRTVEMEIKCDARNTASWRLAERLGFEERSRTERAFESKGEWVDSVVYGRVYGV